MALSVRGTAEPDFLFNQKFLIFWLCPVVKQEMDKKPTVTVTRILKN